MNWQQMILALEESGLKKHDIAERIGMAYSSLCDLARGVVKEPTGVRAVRLHELFKATFPDRQAA